MTGMPKHKQRGDMTSKTIQDLPPELLDQIVSSLPCAGHLAALASSTRPLHHYVENHGWSQFAKSRFPATIGRLQIPDPTITSNATDSHQVHFWRDAVHSLTSSSRSWDRRAFQASAVRPRREVLNLVPAEGVGDSVRHQSAPSWGVLKGQTIGFTPSLDSYEEQTGPRWSDQRHVLAWSAGAELRLHVTELSDEKESFFAYRPQGAVEGRDDLTSVKVIQPQAGRPGAKRAVIDVMMSTVSGKLKHLKIPLGDQSGPHRVVHTDYSTSSRSVRATTVNGSPSATPSSFMAAVLGNDVLSIYDIRDTSDELDADTARSSVEPVGEVQVKRSASKAFRIWSTAFLDSTTVAIGQGPALQPIHLYTIGPWGIHPEPETSVSFSQDSTDSTSVEGLGPIAKTVYPIIPLWDHDGRVFASGGYDGHVRIHDSRSPSCISYTLRDANQSGAIYSLLARPNNRIMAGTAQHALVKVFDMRNQPDLRSAPALSSYTSTSYSYAEALTSTATTTTNGVQSDGADDASGDKDYDLFTLGEAADGRSQPRRRINWGGTHPPSTRRAREHRRADGPVYSLASPSPHSPFVYVGLEAAVTRLAFAGVLDRHPDPFLVAGGDDVALGRAVAGPEGDPEQEEVFRLAMYDKYAYSGRGWQVKKQLAPEDVRRDTVRRAVGLDERWP